MGYKRYEGETEDELIYRICSEKEQIGTWEEVAYVLNSLLGQNYSESAYRKKFQAFNKIMIANQAKFADSDALLQELKEQQRELEKERKKLQTEKLEYNQWLREQARDEMFEEKVIDCIRKNKDNNTKIEYIEPEHNDMEWQLNIADCHYGKDMKVYGLMGEVLNEYSPGIFEQRMKDLFNKTVEKIKMFGIKKLYVNNLGDSTEGFIRNSQIWSLRYGVIDSAINFGNFMAEWLRELSKYTIVVYNQTSGNHDELRLLDGKKNEHLCESSDKIISNIIKIKNEDNPNFTIVENKTGFIFENVAGYNCLGIHGEVPSLAKSIKDYSEIYGINIDYIIGGHKHFDEYCNCGVRKGAIGVGSIMGIDDFSMRIRKSADASAKLCCYESGKGKVADFTIVLN